MPDLNSNDAASTTDTPVFASSMIEAAAVTPATSPSEAPITETETAAITPTIPSSTTSADISIAASPSSSSDPQLATDAEPSSSSSSATTSTATIPTLTAPPALKPAKECDGYNELFLCKFSLEIMVQPVMIASGHTYSRDAVEAWFAAGNSTDLYTHAMLENTVFTNNHTVKQFIDPFLDKHPHLWHTDEVELPSAYINEIVTAVNNKDLSQVKRMVELHPGLLTRPFGRVRTGRVIEKTETNAATGVPQVIKTVEYVNYGTKGLLAFACESRNPVIFAWVAAELTKVNKAFALHQPDFITRYLESEMKAALIENGPTPISPLRIDFLSRLDETLLKRAWESLSDEMIQAIANKSLEQVQSLVTRYPSLFTKTYTVAHDVTMHLAELAHHYEALDILQWIADNPTLPETTVSTPSTSDSGVDTPHLDLLLNSDVSCSSVPTEFSQIADTQPVASNTGPASSSSSSPSFSNIMDELAHFDPHTLRNPQPNANRSRYHYEPMVGNALPDALLHHHRFDKITHAHQPSDDEADGAWSDEDNLPTISSSSRSSTQAQNPTPTSSSSSAVYRPAPPPLPRDMPSALPTPRPLTTGLSASTTNVEISTQISFTPGLDALRSIEAQLMKYEHEEYACEEGAAEQARQARILQEQREQQARVARRLENQRGQQAQKMQIIIPQSIVYYVPPAPQPRPRDVPSALPTPQQARQARILQEQREQQARVARILENQREQEARLALEEQAQQALIEEMQRRNTEGSSRPAVGCSTDINVTDETYANWYEQHAKQAVMAFCKTSYELQAFLPHVPEQHLADLLSRKQNLMDRPVYFEQTLKRISIEHPQRYQIVQFALLKHILSSGGYSGGNYIVRVLQSTPTIGNIINELPELGRHIVFDYLCHLPPNSYRLLCLAGTAWVQYNNDINHIETRLTMASELLQVARVQAEGDRVFYFNSVKEFLLGIQLPVGSTTTEAELAALIGLNDKPAVHANSSSSTSSNPHRLLAAPTETASTSTDVVPNTPQPHYFTLPVGQPAAPAPTSSSSFFGKLLELTPLAPVSRRDRLITIINVLIKERDSSERLSADKTLVGSITQELNALLCRLNTGTSMQNPSLTPLFEAAKRVWDNRRKLVDASLHTRVTQYVMKTVALFQEGDPGLLGLLGRSCINPDNCARYIAALIQTDDQPKDMAVSSMRNAYSNG